jgi:3-oxoacyl-[acyl-carrier-protein] synthase I
MYITSAGLVCSVGLSAAAACAAMRCGIAGFEELPYFDNQREPIIGAAVPGLPLELPRRERLTHMLARSIADCLADGRRRQLEKIPLLVGLSEVNRPGGTADLSPSIVRLVQERLGIRFHPQYSIAIAKGHTSGFEAMRVVGSLFKDPDVGACVVCGADSFLNGPSLAWLDRESRLKTPFNADGTVPGEGAGAVMIERRHPGESYVGVRVAGLGFGQERVSVLSDEPLLGLGLTAAATQALAEGGRRMHEVAFRISDVTGESYGFREQALAVARLLKVRREEDMPIWHSADSVGDTGAAAGLLQLAMMFYAVKKRYSPGDLALCFTGSVAGDRGVALLER